MADRTMLTVLLIGTLIDSSRMGDLNSRIGALNSRVNDLRSRIIWHFDEMRNTWQSELRRVQEVLDARLKHLAEC